MPTLTQNELIDLLNEEAVARAEARTLTNINRRAASLLTDGGYTARPLGNGNYVVISPNKDVYAVYVSDLPAGELFGSSCSCPCFAVRQTCKHLQAIVLSIEENAKVDREYEEAEEAQNFFDSRYYIKH